MLVRNLRDFLRNAVGARNRLIRRARSWGLRKRWERFGAEKPPEELSKVDPGSAFRRLETVVINLDSRRDRFEQFTNEIKKLNLPTWRRISAVDGRAEFPYLNPFFAGSIGCSLSHVHALRQARWGEIEGLLICEDDVEFLAPAEIIEQTLQEFLSNPRLDVLALYGKARGGSHKVSENLRIVVGLVGTVCYVVKPHMAPIISSLFVDGVNDLRRGRRRGKSDVLWNRLQKRGYFFAAPTQAVARNREGFSDIEGRQLGPR